jgi:hypothetical protein
MKCSESSNSIRARIAAYHSLVEYSCSLDAGLVMVIVMTAVLAVMVLNDSQIDGV